MKKFRQIKNTKEASYNLVTEVLKHAPSWDSLKIKVILGSQNQNTYVSVN